ncbi:MAG: hypothetical protein OEY93_02420 [Anaerolineae bacterium]|nr:hypothetical protein [Anaerolineae bacterium]
MTDLKTPTPQEELDQIIQSAQRLGVEMDEEEAIQWLTAIAGMHGEDIVEWNRTEGVFGHKISMLDFSPDKLDYFRKLGKIVEFEDIPGKVETALSLSGSAAQSKIQSYPGDADFFERINIIADSKAEACQIAADIVRQKSLDFSRGDTFQLMEVRFGTYERDVLREGELCKKGSPISWTALEIQTGKIVAKDPDGGEAVIEWDAAAQLPGWTKLDWVVADPSRGELANASNNLDITWEGPDGEIVPLDGYLDPYFQEVYLDAESVPVFSKLSQHVSANALDEYVEQLEKEVAKYITKSPNFGKAAKRMYNIFRLTGMYEEAAFLRELFDEPSTMLYQVGALIRTIEEAVLPGSTISREYVLSQADKLIVNVAAVLDGEEEEEVVDYLKRLRHSIESSGMAPDDPQVTSAKAEVVNLVNNFFYDKLTGMPEIKEYMEEIQSKE